VAGVDERIPDPKDVDAAVQRLGELVAFVLRRPAIPTRA
jgi:hypothetical protein